MYEFLKLQRDIEEIVKNHNANFEQNETTAVENEE
jgi:hypothetical protein